MARSHGKVSTGFWNNPAVRSLPEDARWLLLYLVSCPHSNAAGCFVAPIEYIARDMQWGIERVSEGFRYLSQKPFAVYDQATSIVFIPGWWDENIIENPKVALHVIRLIRDLPDCAIKTSAINTMMRFPQHKSHVIKILSEAFPNGIETVSEASRIPEPEPLPEPEPEPEKIIAASAADDDYSALPMELAQGEEAEAAKAYNAVAEQIGWPQCQKITTNRRTLLRARLRDCGGVEGWRIAMDKARASPFLRGEIGRGKGHENWTPDVDFFLAERNFTKLMEGKYDERSGQSESDLKRGVLEGLGLAGGLDDCGRTAA